LSHVSNIIFSNGQLDPWSAGGVRVNLTTWDLTRTKALFIADAAHHLDLRLPNLADPASVTEARSFETDTIKLWISDWFGFPMV
jgi:lysosomal Pro-X carboxypeptidase